VVVEVEVVEDLLCRSKLFCSFFFLPFMFYYWNLSLPLSEMDTILVAYAPYAYGDHDHLTIETLTDAVARGCITSANVKV
jgi:hypothetical protein